MIRLIKSFFKFLFKITLFFFILFIITAVILYFFGNKILPEKKIYNFINHKLETKTGLQFKYKDFRVSLTEGIVFKKVKVFDNNINIDAEYITLYLSLAGENPYLFNNITIKGSSFRYDKNFLNFLKKITAAQPEMQTGSAAGWLFKVLQNNLISLKDMTVFYGREKININASVYNFTVIKAELMLDRHRAELQYDLDLEKGLVSVEYFLPENQYLGKVNLNLPVVKKGDNFILLLQNQRVKLQSNPYLAKGYYRFDGRLVYRDNIFLKAAFRGLDSQGIRGAFSLNYYFKSGRYKVDLRNLILSSLQYEPLTFSNVSAAGTLTSAKENIKLNAQEATVELDLFTEPVRLQQTRLSYRNDTLTIAPATAFLKKHKYTLSGHAASPFTNLNLKISGSYFSDSLLAAGENSLAGEEESAGADNISLHIPLQFKHIKLSDYAFSDFRGVLCFNKELVTVTNLFCRYRGNELNGSVNYFSDSGKSKIRLYSSLFSLKDGTALLDKDIDISGKVRHRLQLLMQQDKIIAYNLYFSNIDNIFLKDTSLQQSVWGLPIFTSLKSTEDIFYSFRGRIRYTNGSRAVYSLKRCYLEAGEYELILNGDISVAADTFAYKLDMIFYYSDTFKNRYISLGHSYIKSKSTRKPATAYYRKKGWQEVNKIKFAIPFNK
ncbi:MAG TPA: hypothetical protein VKS21_13865 [Spirochaetota bacterium]|nr:hypothetical protein [Spirochaetota bacterium]